MKQLEIPFTYEELLKKEPTPEDAIYLSEIKQGNFRHIQFLSYSLDELAKILYQDKKIDENLQKNFKRYYWQKCYEEGKFRTLQHTFHVAPKRIEKLRKHQQKTEEEKRAKLEEEGKIKFKTLTPEANTLREERLKVHEPATKSTYIISDYSILQHIYSLKGYGRYETTREEGYQKRIFRPTKKHFFEDGICSWNKSTINAIAHQILFLELDSMDKIMDTFEKVRETIHSGENRNENLSPQDLYITFIGLPELGNAKLLLLEEMLSIIKGVPITTLQHREKIQIHNTTVRKKLQQTFNQTNKKELQQQGLEKFRKYNNKYWTEAGGLHYNDPLPNGKIEYLEDNIDKQDELLSKWADGFALANLNEEEKKQILKIVREKFPKKSSLFCCKLQYSDIQNIKDIWNNII